MNSENKRMRSIWFFVGVIMLSIGIIAFIAGIYDLIFPENPNIKLFYLHTNIWWGGIVAITGAIYVLKNKNKYVN